MVSYKLYVEGGGDSDSLRSRCREGFCEFLKKAGCAGRMPRIVACGSRSSAYDHFRTACEQGDECLLLVDSEELVTQASPWQHLRNRTGDGWIKPAGVGDQDCHLMVVCMESWLLADRDALQSFFGHGFNASALPRNTEIEALSKFDIYRALERASANCATKAPYGKGEHSFVLLKKIDPGKVAAASPWCKRFIDTITQ